MKTSEVGKRPDSGTKDIEITCTSCGTSFLLDDEPLVGMLQMDIGGMKFPRNVTCPECNVTFRTVITEQNVQEIPHDD